MKVFISYRRNETQRYAHRLYHSLMGRLGSREVFCDSRSIPPAADFPKRIADAIKDCDLFVLIIGRNTLKKVGRRNGKSNHEVDWVVKEAALALKWRIPVLPVLVNGAQIPSRETLPKELTTLANKQVIETRRHSMAKVVVDIIQQLPQIAVEFELQANKPRAEPDYVIEFSLANPPEWARWVRFRLDDENEQPTRLCKIKESDWTTTYGDYEIQATLLDRPARKARRKRIVSPILISEALRKAYGRQATKAIRKAISKISSN